MTPTDATLREAFREHARDCGCSDGSHLLAWFPPGWRLCGPDDVTVAVDGLATALRAQSDQQEADAENMEFYFPVGIDQLAAAALAALSADTPPSPSADRPREEER